MSGSLLKEEVINVKDLLNNPDLNDLKASEGWLDKWQLSRGIREKQISGKSFDLSEVTVGSWKEQLRELCKGYRLKDIWNMDEKWLFFQSTSFQRPCTKREKMWRWKKVKAKNDRCFFVSTDGGKADKTIIIRKSKKRVVLNVQTPHQNLSKFLISQMKSHVCKLI